MVGAVAKRSAQKGAAAAQAQQAAQPAAAPVEASEQPAEASMDKKSADLMQLKELLDAGVLTQQEFDAQKAQILAG